MKLFKRKKGEDNGGQKGKELTLEQASVVVQSMIRQVNCPYRIFSGQTTLDEIMEEYGKAVEKGKSEGYIPVLVPEDEYLDEYFGILNDEDGYTVEGALSGTVDNGEKILAERLKEYTDPEDDELEALDMDEFTGEIADGEEIRTLTAMLKYDEEGVKETVLFEIPTQNPWEVVAYVPFGGWNDCPSVTEMAAVCKYWFEKYGAVPAAITHDTLEFILPKPVPEEEALEVAREHFAFCSDRVDQCTSTGTLGEVADCIRQSKIWYFWWD